MKKAFFGVAASNLVGAGIGFLINIILARLLDVSLYGRINLILSIIMIFYTIADFGFGSSLVVYYNRHKLQRGYESIGVFNYYYVRWMSIVAMASVVILLGVKNIYLLSVWEYILIYLSAVLVCFYRYACSIHQAVGDWVKYNSLIISNNLIKFIALMVVYSFVAYRVLEVKYYEATLIAYLCHITALIIVTISVSRKYVYVNSIGNVAGNSELKQIILPIGIAGIFVIITMRLDSLIIGKILGPQSLGIYSAANSLALVFPLITGSLMNVMLREASSLKEKMLDSILQNQKKYFVPAIVILVIAMACSDLLITNIFGEKYSECVPIFRILLLAYVGGVYFTPLETYFYANRQQFVLKLKFAQMILLFVFVIVLIDIAGLNGVAYAVVMNRVCIWTYLYLKARNIQVCSAV